MKRSFVEQLGFAYGTAWSLVLAVLIVSACFAAFALQMHAVSEKCSRILQVFLSQAARAPITERQLRVIAALNPDPDVTVSVAVHSTRYSISWATVGASYRPNITVGPRSVLPPALLPAAGFDNAARSSATLGGYMRATAIVNDAEYSVGASPGLLRSICLRTIIVGIVLFCTLGAMGLLVAYALARATVRPVTDLIASLDQMGRGNLAARVVPLSGNNEFTRLSTAFNLASQNVERALAQRDAAEARTHQFVADAGHQLRTPLTVLRGFTGILRNGRLRDPRDAPMVLERMERQIALMTTLVERLMLLESWDTNESVTTDYVDLGGLVCDTVLPIAESYPNRTVTVHPPGGIMVHVDRDELAYAVTNLVTNAIAYSASGPITVRVENDAERARIVVEDVGPGIRPEDLTRIFERFYRGPNRDVRGSGLGLAIARRAVERAHGRLTVASDYGKGSFFTIDLPLAPNLEQ